MKGTGNGKTMKLSVDVKFSSDREKRSHHHKQGEYLAWELRPEGKE